MRQYAAKADVLQITVNDGSVLSDSPKPNTPRKAQSLGKHQTVPPHRSRGGEKFWTSEILAVCRSCSFSVFRFFSFSPPGKISGEHPTHPSLPSPSDAIHGVASEGREQTPDASRRLPTPASVPRSATQRSSDGPTHSHSPNAPEWARGGDS